MSIRTLLVIAVVLSSLPTFAARFYKENVRFSGFRTTFHVGYHKATDDDRGTVFWLNGFSDQMGNHLELFRQFKRSGLRVVSFDYPEHGGSNGEISIWKLREISGMAGKVMRHARIDRSRPVILAGFSAGGTIAIRMVQQWRDSLPRGLKVSGLFLLSPGAPVRVTAGTFSFIREEDLTRGRLRHEPRPNSTLSAGRFVSTLKDESREAARTLLPANLPTVIYLGDDREDDFIHVRKVKKWIEKNQRQGNPVTAFQCPEAYHFLDAEPYGIGRMIKSSSGRFTRAMTKRRRQDRIQAVEDVANRTVRTSNACRLLQ